MAEDHSGADGAGRLPIWEPVAGARAEHNGENTPHIRLKKGNNAADHAPLGARARRRAKARVPFLSFEWSTDWWWLRQRGPRSTWSLDLLGLSVVGFPGFGSLRVEGCLLGVRGSVTVAYNRRLAGIR